MINRSLNYLTQKGVLPRIYENLADVKAELKPQKLRLKTMEGRTTWRTIDHRTREVLSERIKEPSYHILYSPILEAVMRLLIFSIILGTIFNCIKQGIIIEEIIKSLLSCLLCLIFAANVRASIIIMFILGGIPLFFLLFMIFSGDQEQAKEFLSESYYGLLFIGNLLILICAWLTFTTRLNICIVYPDDQRGVYVKYSAELKEYFNV